MLVNGMSATEIVKLFHVNTNATIERASLAGMSIRIFSKGGLPPADLSYPGPRPGRNYRHLTREDRIFINMAISSAPSCSTRAIGSHLGVAPSTVFREIALVDCHGVFGQWALLKWGFTESRDQYDHSTPEIFAGVQR